MATLEKIRKRSVLLLIVIGVALLAFIIGDFFNSSRTLFGPDTNVAKFGKEKIEAQEFQARLNNMQRADGGEEASAMQTQQMLYSMILEKLNKEQYDKLGLTVTDKELSDAINGNNPAAISVANQMAGQYFGQLLQGPVSPAQFYQITNNPASFGIPQEMAAQTKAIWQEYENKVSELLLQQKFNSIVSGTMTVNKLEAAQMYAIANTAYDLASVTKTYASLNAGDKKYAVTEEDLNKAWEAEKNRFYVPEESRLINTIVVPIVPSAADVVATEEMLAEVVADLNKTEGLEGLRGRKGFETHELTMTYATINDQIKRGANAEMKAFLDSAKVGEAGLTSKSGNYYQLMKLNARGMEVDSLTLSAVVLNAENGKLADSISALLSQGVSADTIAKNLNSEDGFMVANVTTSLTAPGQELQVKAGQLAQLIASDLANHKDVFLSKANGEVFSLDSLNGNDQFKMMYVVNGRQAPMSNASFTMITYMLSPSAQAVKDLRSKLEKFLAESPTAEKFATNALTEKYQYNPQTYEISASSPVINQMTYNMYGQPQDNFVPNSNELATWALEANKGDVSKVYGGEATGNFIVGAVNDVYGEYRTLSDPQVRSIVTEQVRKDKMAASLIDQYKGKANSVEGYAATMTAPLVKNPVTFQDGRTYGPELLGKIFGSTKDKLYGPTQGEIGVTVYKVTNILAPTRKMSESDKQSYQMERQQIFSPQSPFYVYMLLGDRKIENRYNKVFHK